MSAIQQLLLGAGGVKKLSAGASTLFNNAFSRTAATATIDTTRTLVVYRDNGNSDQVTAVVLTASGGTVTAGAEVVVSTSTSTGIVSCTMLNSTYGIVVYLGATTQPAAKLVSVSGTTISTGTEHVFDSVASDYFSVTALDSSRALVVYTDSGGSTLGRAKVLTASWPTITSGALATFQPSFALSNKVTALSSALAVAIYSDGGNSSYQTACAMSISGTSISPGTPVVMGASSSNGYAISKLDSTRAIALSTTGAGSSGIARVLSISGTSVSVGAAVTFEPGNSSSLSVAVLGSDLAIGAVRDDGNSGYGTACALSISGTSISAGNPIVFESSGINSSGISALSTSKAVVAYSTDSAGLARVLTFE